MTSNPDTSSAPSPLVSDGMRISTLATLGAQNRQTVKSYWASGRRALGNTSREILEVSFGSKRLVNQVSFQISHFPLTCWVEYLDDNKDWQRFTYAQAVGTGTHRIPANTVVQIGFSDSVPAKVNSSQATSSPQHFGKNHWVSESWKVTPVNTSKIRFVITRPKSGHPPVDPRKHHVAYSVALQNVQIGYRVYTPVDIPTKPQDWWASSKDILGSRTVYSTYTQPADQVIDGDSSTFWRSDPQPFPFAVVNLFLDARQSDGSAPVIDRWWIDPVTVGPICNVYYCDEEPMGDFAGLSTPIPSSWLTEVGNPTNFSDNSTGEIEAIDLGPTFKTGVYVSDEYMRMHYNEPWWVGIDARSLVSASDPQSRPLISLGSTRVVQEGGVLKVVSQSGTEADITLDPALHGVNASFRVVVAYYPADPASGRGAYFRLVYALSGYAPVYSEAALAGQGLDDVAGPIAVGLHPDPANTDVSAISLLGMVIKTESLDQDTEDWFLAEGADYVADPLTPQNDRGTAQNARLRIHPDFYTSTNPYAMVGGACNCFGDMSWTPITRDYTLRRGYLHLPPTKARYWKFEMTQLLPKVYENFVTIDRETLVFPPDIVEAYQATTASTSTATPSGVKTLASAAPNVSYQDALQIARSSVSPDAASVLVIKDPNLAAQAAASGWIWTYQPWHVGSSAPQFPGTQVHRYESIKVRHSTKVAFFAAVKELTPFRVDYAFNDDTVEYIEHMRDDFFLDTSDAKSIELTDGSATAQTSYAEITSIRLDSYRTVRGVQFATQETEAVQVLPDSEIVSEESGLWFVYGDAGMTHVGPSDMLISRGWFSKTWGNIEHDYPTFGDLEGVLWGALEGNDAHSGYSEGGIYTSPYSPSGAGKVMAQATVSAETSTNFPVRLEIVATSSDEVVASTQAYIRQGETKILEIGYTPGTLASLNTWGDIETLDPTFGNLDGKTWGSLESTQEQTDLYVRVRQLGPSRDDFHIHRLALYDSPIAWYFSNDDGATWWQAVDVRNDPHGVLLFPFSNDPSPGPTVGRSLRWRARFFRAGATVNAIHIRPWYGSHTRSSEGVHTLESLGPNHSIYDVQPDIVNHPMWLPRFNSIERQYVPAPPASPFWRNLVPNPSIEGADVAGSFSADGGTIQVAVVDPAPGGQA